MKLIQIIFILILLFFLIFLIDDEKIQYFFKKDFQITHWILFSILGIYFIINKLDFHIYGFIILFYVFYYSTIFYNKVMEYSFLQNILPNSFFEYQQKVENDIFEQENQQNDSDSSDSNNDNDNENEKDSFDANEIMNKNELLHSIQNSKKINTNPVQQNSNNNMNNNTNNTNDNDIIQQILYQSYPELQQQQQNNQSFGHGPSMEISKVPQSVSITEIERPIQ